MPLVEGRRTALFQAARRLARLGPARPRSAPLGSQVSPIPLTIGATWIRRANTSNPEPPVNVVCLLPFLCLEIGSLF